MISAEQAAAELERRRGLAATTAPAISSGQARQELERRAAEVVSGRASPIDPQASASTALFTPLAEGAGLGLGNKALSALGALGGSVLGEGLELVNSEFENPGFDALFSRGVDIGNRNLERVRQAQPTASALSEGLGLVGGGAAAASTRGAQAVANLASRGGFLGRVGAGASGGLVADQAASVANAPAGQEIDAILNPDIGAGTAAGAAVPVLGSLFRAVTPVIDDAVRPLVSRARDFNIPLRVDQVAPSRLRRTVQNLSQSIPGSSTDSFESLQRKRFTQAAAKTIGLNDVDSLGAESIQVFQKSNREAFEKALSGNNVRATSDELASLGALKKKVGQTLGITGRDASIVNRDIDNVFKELSAGDISPRKLSNIRSDVLRSASKAGKAAPLYEGISDVINSAARRTGNADLLDRSRLDYRNFKVLEPLIESSVDGIIDPLKLLQKVNSSRYVNSINKATGEDELIDLARIGRLLPRGDGSETASRLFLLGQGGALGAGLASSPLAAGTVAGGTILGNRAFQRGVLQNQALIRQGLRDPASLPFPIRGTTQADIGRGAALGTLATQGQGTQ